MRKAFILIPFLVLFAALIMSLNHIAINEFRQTVERSGAPSIDIFSLVEIETFRRTKDQFLSFNPADFEFTAGEWLVEVTFTDEIAQIIYSGPETVKATLEYDMVMKNVLEYQINNSALSDSD